MFIGDDELADLQSTGGLVQPIGTDLVHCKGVVHCVNFVNIAGDEPKVMFIGDDEL